MFSATLLSGQVAGGPAPFVRLADSGMGARALICPKHGGELCSLVVPLPAGPRELLYRAMDFSEGHGWQGRAPVLWPAVGQSATSPPESYVSAAIGDYLVSGQSYPMPVHGFLRSEAFRVESIEQGAAGAAVTLISRSSPSTEKYYPFSFEFRLRYWLGAGRLKIRYHVKAGEDNATPMPFSAGNHITFGLPLAGIYAAEDLWISHSCRTIIEKGRNAFPNGRLRSAGGAAARRLSDIRLSPSCSLSEGGAHPAITMRPASGFSLQISHDIDQGPHTAQFNLWGDLSRGCFAPEPWVGVANSLNSGQGLVQLSPGEDWHWEIAVEFMAGAAGWVD